MTTFQYTIEIDDSERITLDAALSMLKAECDLQIAKKQNSPYLAHLRSIASIENKLATGAQQMTGNPFGTDIYQSLHRLADFPVLETLAKVQTTASRLDGRACRFIYQRSLHEIDLASFSEPERQFFDALGFDVKKC